MTAFDFPVALLRARLLLMRLGAIPCAALALCLLGAGGWTWVGQQRAALARELAHPAPAAAPPLALALPAASSANQNLTLFYDSLGERRYAEQQVQTLFALAAKAGLSLNQGEYKVGYDQASRVSTYQVMLPVKGSYQAIWQFALQVLRTVPFASLDELSFKRELIGDPSLEAHLRLTFYLKDTPP
ncbi:hypothetical protein AAKU55_005189 [Oxalobacteraceae bacterium GrIS 1.11]